MFGVPDRGSRAVHPADEVLVPADFLGRRPAPVPRKHRHLPPLGAQALADRQVQTLLQGNSRQLPTATGTNSKCYCLSLGRGQTLTLSCNNNNDTNKCQQYKRQSSRYVEYCKIVLLLVQEPTGVCNAIRTTCDTEMRLSIRRIYASGSYRIALHGNRPSRF